MGPQDVFWWREEYLRTEHALESGDDNGMFKNI